MKGIDQYLARAHGLRIIPNFWLTREYLSIQPNIKLETDGKFIWLQEDEWAVFPPLPLNCKDFSEQPPKRIRIWSDFVNYSVGEPIQFLDWEYTYAADVFNMMR